MRKKTSILHIACGAIAILAQVMLQHNTGALLVVSFGLFEFWQEYKTHDSGCLDFWEFLVGMVSATVIILILHAITHALI